MTVGTRYPEGRIGRPREIGGRHVRKEEEGFREGGPEGLRKAHEARAGHGPEDAGAQGVVQGDREGAGQVALDGERRGGVAQVRDGAEGQARRARGRLRRPVGGLTDNGAEFSDEGAIAALLGEGPGETRLFYCDPRRSDQKGACERNHVEIRKLLPKGAGIRFDRLAPADLALAMSHVNSEPRGALGFSTPARAFRAMLGEDAAALLDAYGVGDVALGGLDLTPGLIERARAERGDAPLA